MLHLARAVTTLACLLALGSVSAQAPASTDVGGISFPNQMTLGGTPVQLNGAGVRYRAVFKVYAAGLYLTSKAQTLDAVLAAPGPKRIHLVLMRNIDAKEFGKILSAGIQKNATREEFSQSLPGIMRMGEVSSQIKLLVPGDTLTVEWLPGVGTTLYVKGKPEVGPFKEPGFFNAMAKIWLGSNPADHLLKDALLGQARAEPGN